MPATPEQRRNRGQYQPRLPLTGAQTVPTGGRGRSIGRASTAPGRRSPGGSPVTAPTAAARAASPGGAVGWRLDEKTRRAGRQGVAAARAALAGTARVGDDRREHAA